MEDNSKEVRQEELSYLYNLDKNSRESNSFINSIEKYNDNLNLSSSSGKNKVPKKKYSIQENNDLKLSFISYETEEFNDKSLCQYFDNKNNHLSIEKMKEIINYLIDFYEKKYNFRNRMIIRCFHDDMKEKEKCSCIPIIKKKNLGMSFSCDDKIYKDLKIEDIIKLILEKKLFEEIPNNEEKIKEKQKQKDISKSIMSNESKNEINENIINNEPQNEVKEGLIKIKKIESDIDINNYIINIQMHIFHLLRTSEKEIEKSIKNYRLFMDEYNKNEILQKEIQRKIKNIFFSISKYLNNFIYFHIIKKLINESSELEVENKNMENLRKNLKEADKYINGLQNIDKVGLLSDIRKKFKLNWMIPFYYKEEIKTVLDKNTFIAISKDGYIFIYLLNNNANNNSNEKTELKLVKKQDLNHLKVQAKIVKLKNIYKTLENNGNNNYFLISSFIEETALIINITENFENSTEKKYEIEIIQVIKFERGLYSSLEIEYKGNYYLLYYHKNFNIWFYDENKSEIVNKDIKVKKLKSDVDINCRCIYGPLIQGQNNKNLIIAQTIIPVQKIEIYIIDESNEDISLNQIGFININTDNYISMNNNNYFLYKDKYLLLTSTKNKKTNKKGGIFLFDIEKCECINYFQFKNVLSINCILRINPNILICSSDIIIHTQRPFFNEGGLFILNIEEKDNKIDLKMKNDKILKGKYKYIDCDNFIFDSYFSSSSKQNNGIIRINGNNELIHYFNIYNFDHNNRKFFI